MNESRKKETIYEHAGVIIDNMLNLYGKSQTKFAQEILGIQGPNISDARKSGKIPDRWFEIVEEKFKKTKDALIQQAKNEYSKGRVSVRAQVNLPYGHDSEKTNPAAGNSAAEMLIMTTAVLESDTVYRSALASNIRAFYQAVKGEQEMSDLREEVKKLHEKIDELKELMHNQENPEKKHAGNNN